MRYILLSGGEGSWRAAKIDHAKHPGASVRFIFTDTLYEDADTYRFLIESAADVLGRKLNGTVSPDDFPNYRVAEDVPLEEYRGNPEWRAFLADLRERTMQAIPELIWLVEGRDPWEIFRDERFLGNSRVDPCSKKLKRQMLERWLAEHGSPEADTLIYGIGLPEEHRFDDGEGHGVRPRMSAQGWNVEAPLIEAERLGVHLIELLAPPERFGIRRQRLYRLGYMHGNCGGFCIKAGQAHWQNRHRVHPDRIAYDAMMERKLGAFLGQGTILVDRRGGTKKPLTLDEFIARLEAQPEIEYAYERGTSGCGCMLDEAA